MFPEPWLSLSINGKQKGEEEKGAMGLKKLSHEDPSIRYYTNDETREQILSGLGEQHLDLIVNKLKTKFGVEITLTTPRVAFRETI